MLAMMFASGFFSCSEAALFYLTREDRELLAAQGMPGEVACHLLGNPDRLLSAILFCNLVINVAYFAVSSVVGLGLQRAGETSVAGGLAVASLLGLIVLSELLPKNLAVLFPRGISRAVALPIAGATRMLDPIMPTLQWVNSASRRILFPNFAVERYLELSDIERAITLSTPDKSLAQLEELVLQQVVGLSDLTVEEVMQPRVEAELFRPPVKLSEVRLRPPTDGFVLVAEPDSDEVDAVIMLDELPADVADNLQRYAEPVAYIPWSATASSALEVLRHRRSSIAIVIDEYGHTIGTITLQQLLQWLVAPHSIDRGQMRRIGRATAAGEGEWQVDAATSLRRVSKQFGFELGESKSVTIGGLLQDGLQRMPQKGDTLLWQELAIEVLAAPRPGKLVARIRRALPTDQTTPREESP
jgi:CBS domain containing-hemolysin-like protein